MICLSDSYTINFFGSIDYLINNGYGVELYISISLFFIPIIIFIISILEIEINYFPIILISSFISFYCFINIQNIAL